ncbi:Extracellular metalloprotease [Acrodontium crateriforme]|uniref:Extracellular metalloprotease n=1 Tax=Acrodontium crateriforme TaxID=150365 RepID=A0AAQ3R9P4_9PEZI|nr:Extracellular metalloprotease [Acrodontium crateriforme]
MKNTVILTAFAAIAAANASFTGNSTHFVDPTTNQIIQHFECDVHQGKASAHFNRTIAALHRDPSQHFHRRTLVDGNVEPHNLAITIPLYFHIITKTTSVGSITQAVVGQQLVALNTAYRPYGIRFVLQATTFTANDAWAIGAGDDLAAAKTALRKGTYNTLNFYFHTDLTAGLLGTCTLPSDFSNGLAASAYSTDGCSINAHTLPGGSFAGYNLGKTAVHETGQWLGLLHTFEGNSCTGPGDSITDTPAESVSTSGCPVKPPKDSCPSIAGFDPVHNYMDYPTGECYTNFTPGQVARIDKLWKTYRAGR